VTPTATARFYQLLDLLSRDGYLHTIDAAASPAKLKHAFAAIPEGSFVRLSGCTLRLPGYVRLEQIWRASRGTESPLGAVLTATQNNVSNGGATSYDEITSALGSAGRLKQAVGSAEVAIRTGAERRLGHAIDGLERAVGSNPRVPLSTCDGKTDYRPRGVDLLFPIRLGGLSGEASLLAGPVTLVGKLVRAVRKPGQEYVDDASFATFSGPTNTLDSVQAAGTEYYKELDADAVVLAPGAVILPIAIYK
jgi:hypothetical protein